MPSHFPCIPVIRECSWKKTQIEKKYIYVYIYIICDLKRDIIICIDSKVNRLGYQEHVTQRYIEQKRAQDSDSRNQYFQIKYLPNNQKRSLPQFFPQGLIDNLEVNSSNIYQDHKHAIQRLTNNEHDNRMFFDRSASNAPNVFVFVSGIFRKLK